MLLSTKLKKNNFLTYLKNIMKLAYSKYLKFNFFYNLKLNSLIYIRNILLVLLIDTLIIDDEPIWEPLEWTLVQTWLLYIFLFSWIAETIITSKYGSFTGRDKRVYLGLYRTYWLTEIWFMFNILVTCVFVIVPFYFEISYSLSSIVTWWEWYDVFFFFKISLLFLITNLISLTTKLGLRWLNWKKVLLMLLLLSFILAYVLYTQFIIFFFSFFGDVNWYKKSGYMDFNNLSNGPLKWGWGEEDRDLFTYHPTPTGFWYKNDPQYAGSFFLINFYLLFSVLMLYIQFLFLIRKIYSTKEVSYTFLVYGLSSVNQFFYSYLLLLGFLVVSFVYQLLRLPNDLFWFDKTVFIINSFLENLLNLI